MIIRTETGPHGTVMQLVGRFDAHEIDGFRHVADPLMRPDTKVLQIDLSQVAFVDSTALAELVRLQKSALVLDGELTLVAPSDAVRVILEITALAGMFTIVASAPEAP